jgi:hypothetical protein
MNGDALAAETVGDGVKPGAKKLASVIGTVTVKGEEKRKELLIGINKSQISCKTRLGGAFGLKTKNSFENSNVAACCWELISDNPQGVK